MNPFYEDEKPAESNVTAPSADQPAAPAEETATQVIVEEPLEAAQETAPAAEEAPAEAAPEVEAAPSVEESPAAEEAVPEEKAEEPDPALTAIQALSDKIDLLSQQFEAKIAHTEHEEKIVDQMHAELQKYKSDMYAQLVRPILLDVIDVRDSITRIAGTYAAKPEEEQKIPLKMFSDYTFDLQEILEKNNISIYKSEEGSAFTPVRQRVVKKVTTPIEELHGKVAESMSDGYEYLGKTISPEKIAVYFYEAPKNEPEKTEGEQE